MGKSVLLRNVKNEELKERRKKDWRKEQCHYMCFNLLVPECTTILLPLFTTAVAIVLGHVLVYWTEEPALI